ncbi:MAG: tRNA dihydrouridine(20/20a) synthase DusA [Alphaproteobacteria bacterium]|nr:tRNA dihydrouridine(20/20a) synthase DusA [Alphaproteobacteria bacterium]NCQ87895.1 tRNA dihydrouridine(20/20a) synthase DusA [Alphaproteobacteria bacterium]NCT05598.1 tRNA dihydrouridine(20/20a) synthase DusA [Alphaproteobacteria bacterium]
MNKTIKHISVAPMMDWTDRHCRYFHRLIAPSILLYTEMITTQALKFGDQQRFLRYSDAEHPVALQLGGSDPADLALSAKMGADVGFDEINLNCGCPSDRVQSGSFGACLMKEPELVRDCIAAMREVVDIPVTVKCRIGIDDSEDYTFLEDFIGTVADGGCKTFIIHARKAWLKGLSPKENREIPPLQFDIVERIKDAFPNLTFPVNGGIKTLEDARQKYDLFDGVMIGREAYQNPWFLRTLEEEFFGTENLLTREQVVEAMIPYIIDQRIRYDTPMKSITRHMTGLFQGMPGARNWRQILSTQVHLDGATPDLLINAIPNTTQAE